MCWLRYTKCNASTTGQSVAHYALSQGYCLLFMHKDIAPYMSKCDKCSCFTPIFHFLAKKPLSIVNPLDFTRWWINITGLLSTAPPQKLVFLQSRWKHNLILTKIWHGILTCLTWIGWMSLNRLHVPNLHHKKNK